MMRLFKIGFQRPWAQRVIFWITFETTDGGMATEQFISTLTAICCHLWVKVKKKVHQNE
jgi:hypothetical protein